MVSMSRRGALGAKADHDVRPAAPEKTHHVGDERHGVELWQRTVGVSRQLYVLHAEYLRGCRELGAADHRQLGARRNGDAGAFPGVPIGGAKQITSNTGRRVSGDRPTDGEGLVVGVREDAGEGARQRTRPISSAGCLHPTNSG